MKHIKKKGNMENKLKLPDIYIKKLANLPESGMGYQIIIIELKNGLELKDRIVLNSTFLKLDEGECININDIKEIELQKK